MEPKASENSKNPLLLHLTTCDGAVQSSDGKATLYGLFNRIDVGGIPTNFQGSMTLFVTFGYGDAGKYAMHFHVASPSGKKVFDSPEVNFELRDGKAINNMFFRFQGFPLPEEGPYKIALYLGEGTVPMEERVLFFVERTK